MNPTIGQRMLQREAERPHVLAQYIMTEMLDMQSKPHFNLIKTFCPMDGTAIVSHDWRFRDEVAAVLITQDLALAASESRDGWSWRVQPVRRG